MKVKANSQKYQALYIDTDAKESKDRIVLIEETCDSLPQAQGILNSMLKEPYYGVVIEGSSIAIMKFRSKLIDADIESGLGSKDVADLLSEIVNLAYANKCEIPYFKGPVQYGDLPQVSVAIDLKSLFDLGNLKGAGKEFMDNLIGVNKELREQVEKIDLKEYKKTQEWIRKNEKEYKEIEKLLKDGDKKTVDLDNFLKDALIGENGFEEFLGEDYDTLSYYVIPADVFKKADPEASDEEYSIDEIENDKHAGDFSSDPRKKLKDIVLKTNTDYAKPMDKSNLVEVGMSSDSKNLLVVLKKPVKLSLDYWPSGPAKMSYDALTDYIFLGQKKIG